MDMQKENRHPVAAADKGRKSAALVGWTVTILLLCALIVLNVLAGLIPATLRVIDTTDNGLYTISSATKQLLHSLNEEVTVYVLNASQRLGTVPKTVLDRYSSTTAHLKVKTVDVTSEAAVQALSEVVDLSTLSNESVVVVSNRRSTSFNYSDCEYYSVPGIGSMTPDEYTYYVYNFGAYAEQLKESDMPNIWIPKAGDFHHVEALPLLGSGKLDLRKLKEMASQLD